MRQYDLAVIGAGIAGLAIAEIFARSGHRVVLVDKSDVVCGEASGAHHGWFHFGSLYSIFPNNQFMRTLVGGIDDLLEYYRQFPGMNIAVGSGGKLRFGSEGNSWIRDEPIQYIVSARNDRDFALHEFDGLRPYLRKLFFTLTWDLAIKQFISRHQRFHKFDWRTGPASQNIPQAGWFDYSREVIHKVGDIDIDLDKNTHFRIEGFDRPMNTANIVAGLLRSYLSSGGELFLNRECTGYVERSGKVEIETSSGTVCADRVILAAGRNLAQLLGRDVTVNVVASPLLVVYPSVCDRHFVRLTPFVDQSVNHLLHYSRGQPYSLIGGGYTANPNAADQVEDAKARLLAMAARVLPKVGNAAMRQTYVSYKTEVVSRHGERNYQYFIRTLSDRAFAVVPGKFSLAFSLAVNAYKHLDGKAPSSEIQYDMSIDPTQFIGLLKHEKLVADFLDAPQKVRDVAAEPMPVQRLRSGLGIQ